MEEALARKLRHLVAGRSVAALGTLHSGAPWVSMVPYAPLEDGSAFIVHVSRLAAHTSDMLAEPRVSLMVMDPEQPGVSPLTTPRVTIAGTAAEIPESSPAHERARDAYLRRFPDSEPTFALGDFSLFAITPTSARWVAGFAQAVTITAASFAQIIAEERAAR